MLFFTIYKCVVITLGTAFVHFKTLIWVQITRVAASADGEMDCAYEGAHLPLKEERLSHTCMERLYLYILVSQVYAGSKQAY